MFSSIGKVKSSFTNTYFILASLVLLLVLFIRVTRGLDLTDEMQYYGEIKGLIETGKLFSNDLFIQQSVYILLYPMFYIYHKLFDYEGFVFFGRLIMAVLTIAVFIYAYRKLLEFKFSAHVAGLTALSLTFAIPYHGIFAPSYNTISQVLWIIFVIRFFEWKQQRAISWAAIPVITAFAHPTSAVMMAVLILMRMSVERDFKQVAKVILALLGGGLIALPIVLYFASPEAYLDSLKFSSGYGVGTAFFSSKSQLITLLLIYALFGAAVLFWKHLRNINFALLASLVTATSIVVFAAGLANGAYTSRTIYVIASLSALAYVWLISNYADENLELRQRSHWLVLSLLVFATSLGVTSGNGLGQATGGFMVGLPVLFGLAVSTGVGKENTVNATLKITCMALVCILFVTHWSSYPYREAGWWRVNQSIQSVPAFKFIATSQDRSDFLQQMKQALEPISQRKRTLIVSEYPAFYQSLNVSIETCMLYMHSLTSDRSESVLKKCLHEKNPEIVIDIHSNNDFATVDSRIKNVMRNYYEKRSFSCEDKSINFASDGKLNANHVNYHVCAI
jgi:hypothetical protein